MALKKLAAVSKEMQINNVSFDYAPCKVCGEDLVQLGNFRFVKDHLQTDRYKQEHCTCNSCGVSFIVHYDFFDSRGHINGYVISTDINDPEYRWQDNFTLRQVFTIENHLESCKHCKENLVKQNLNDKIIFSGEFSCLNYAS